MRFSFILTSLVILCTVRSFAQDQLSRSEDTRLYKKGLELVEHANYGAAREVFSEFLKTAEPTDARRPDAEYYRAFSALNLGHSDSEKLIENFISNNPSNPRSVTAYYDLGNFFYEDRSYSKAIEYYKKVNFSALSLQQQVQGRFNFGYSYFNVRKLNEALNEFNFVKTQNSSYSPAANYYAGFIEYSNGEYEEALVDLKRAETNPSYAPIVPYLIANVYYKLRQYDELITYYEVLTKKATSINSYDEIAMLVADAYYFKGDYERAAAAYEEYLDENTNRAEGTLLFRAGFANYSLSKYDKAIEYLKTSAAKQDSVSYYASYYLGILYLKDGNKQAAATSFDHARKYDKDKKFAEESLFQYAKVAYDQGKPDLSISEFEKFLKLYPNSDHSTEVRELLAQAYVNGNNYNKAIEYVESLPQKTPAVQRAYQKATYLKGAELFNKEDYQAAVAYFSKSLSYPVEPNYVALSALWSGEAYSIGRKFQEAVPMYLKVITLNQSIEPETMARARYGLGYAYFNLKQYDQALTSFKDYTTNHAKSGKMYKDALVRLADCYYAGKSYQEAVANYNQARKLNSVDDDYIVFQTGMIQGILRNYADARNQFKILIANYPKSQYRDEAMFQAAQFEIEQGNYQVAIDGLTRLINEGKGSPFLPSAYLRRATAYYNLKQYDKTIGDYGDVIKKFNSHPAAKEALLPLQEALGLAGRSDEFDTYLNIVKKANPESKDLEIVEFEAAKGMYFNQQYQRSITSLNSFITSYPESSRMQEAKYYLAESYYRQRDFEKSLPVYVELSNDPNFNFYSRVAGRIAEVEFKLGMYERAVLSFHRQERIAGSKKDFYNAWSGLMESFYLLAKYDSADTYANLILEKGNVNAGAVNKAQLYLGKSAMARGDFDTAKDEFLNTLNTARDEYGAEAKYLLGEIFYQTKDYGQCYETLVSLISDFAAYEEWVGRAFLLLADNYIAQNEIFQAKGTLESLIDGKFPLAHIVNAAKDKLAKLNEQQKEETQKAIKADSTGNN